MSRQLAISITLSVMAMTAFALLGDQASSLLGGSGVNAMPLSAAAPALPELTQLLPALQ